MNKSIIAGLLVSIGFSTSVYADTFTSAEICKAAIPWRWVDQQKR